MKQLLIAIHSIVTSDRTAEMQFTGRYNDGGEPILRKAQTHIQPGTFFHFDEGEELEKLLELGAARVPEELELLAYHEAQESTR